MLNTTTEKKFYLNDEIADCALRGAISTLKKIFFATNDSKVGEMYFGLLRDSQVINNINIIDYTVSDGYDCFLVAYEYLQGEYNKGYAVNTLETRVLKNGNEKVKDKFGWMCTEVRKYIYNHGQTDFKRTYIECQVDKDGNRESMEEAQDRILYKVGKFYDINNEKGVLVYEKLIAVCRDMTARQQLILHYRLQGLSVNDIAGKLGVHQSTISKHLKAIQDRVRKSYPEAVAVCIDRVNHK